MKEFKRKLLSVYPNLSDKQMTVLIRGFSDGIKQEEIFQFANPTFSPKVMDQARSDAMDGYFVSTWLDLDFSEDQMLQKRNQILYFEERILSMKI